jgi:hypothetical protein
VAVDAAVAGDAIEEKGAGFEGGSVGICEAGEVFRLGGPAFPVEGGFGFEEGGGFVGVAGGEKAEAEGEAGDEVVLEDSALGLDGNGDGEVAVEVIDEVIAEVFGDDVAAGCEFVGGVEEGEGRDRQRGGVRSVKRMGCLARIAMVSMRSGLLATWAAERLVISIARKMNPRERRR